MSVLIVEELTWLQFSSQQEWGECCLVIFIKALTLEGGGETIPGLVLLEQHPHFADEHGVMQISKLLRVLRQQVLVPDEAVVKDRGFAFEESLV